MRDLLQYHRFFGTGDESPGGVHIGREKHEHRSLTKHINVWLYVDMKSIARTMKLLSDTARLRILMVLTKRELCVCQIMGVLGISQPLVSRNLALLKDAGLLDERKDGKLVFYSIKKDMAPTHRKIVGVLREAMKSDRILSEDLRSLMDCEEFRKKTGRCDMKTFSDFVKRRRARAT